MAWKIDKEANIPWINWSEEINFTLVCVALSIRSFPSLTIDLGLRGATGVLRRCKRCLLKTRLVCKEKELLFETPIHDLLWIIRGENENWFTYEYRFSLLFASQRKKRGPNFRFELYDTVNMGQMKLWSIHDTVVLNQNKILRSMRWFSKYFWIGN